MGAKQLKNMPLLILLKQTWFVFHHKWEDKTPSWTFIIYFNMQAEKIIITNTTFLIVEMLEFSHAEFWILKGKKINNLFLDADSFGEGLWGKISAKIDLYCNHTRVVEVVSWNCALLPLTLLVVLIFIK
jgi:hypothetical protein